MKWSCRMMHRIGHRGSALLFFALLDMVYALSLAKPPAEAKLSASLAFIRHVAPLKAWAALWLVVGVMCLIGAFMTRDRWAFAAAMLLKTLWGFTFLLGWIVYDLDRGWVSSVLWLAMAGWVAIIASWPEPPVPVSLEDIDVR